jgi:hypothetical protein
MLGADYLILVSLISFDKSSRVTADQAAITTYRLTMSAKVLDSVRGGSVFGKNVTHQYPVNTGSGGGSDDGYLHSLSQQGAEKLGAVLAASAATWRRVAPADAAQVSFTVSTTIDELINGLELGARAPNDLLGELRHAVGGCTVELDGAALGSTPGTFKATPGLHQLRVSRPWMKAWQQTVNIQEGAVFRVALELSSEGLAKWSSAEAFKAAAALAYAEAAFKRGVKINFDTQAWRDVSIGNRGSEINMQKQEIRQEGAINQALPTAR